MTRTIDPLYVFAGNQEAYAARLNRLGPDDVAVITSANSGPHPSSPELMQHVADMTAKGVTPLGYVPLDYGRRSLDDVLGDIVAWHRLYGVPRCFLDEWPQHWTAHHLGSLWGAIRGYARPTPADPMILAVNPGTGVTLDYPPPVGCYVVTHESATLPDRTPAPWEIAIVHSVPAELVAATRLILGSWSYAYVTADGGLNPYDES